MPPVHDIAGAPAHTAATCGGAPPPPPPCTDLAVPWAWSLVAGCGLECAPQLAHIPSSLLNTDAARHAACAPCAPYRNGALGYVARRRSAWPSLHSWWAARKMTSWQCRDGARPGGGANGTALTGTAARAPRAPVPDAARARSACRARPSRVVGRVGGIERRLLVAGLCEAHGGFHSGATTAEGSFRLDSGLGQRRCWHFVEVRRQRHDVRRAHRGYDDERPQVH